MLQKGTRIEMPEVLIFRKSYMKVKLRANELVIKAADTQHLSEHGQIAGKMILTNQGVYFKSLKPDKSAFDVELLFQQVKEVLTFRNRLLFPNGLKLVTRDGRELCFALAGRDGWCEAIARMC